MVGIIKGLARTTAKTLLGFSKYELISRTMLSDLQEQNRSLRLTLSPARSQRIFSHPLTRGLPPISVGLVPATRRENDLAIARRILDAYNFTVANERAHVPSQEKDIWEQIRDAHQSDLISILRRNDPSSLVDFFLNYGTSYVSFGGLTQGLDGYNRSGEELDVVAASYFERLVCLAEALGVLYLENPEQGRWGENLYVNCDDLVDSIEKHLGIDIAPPQDSLPLFGIKTGKGLFHYRNINSLYCAWKVHGLLKTETNPSVCEIGGGFGGVALYCSRLGLTNYTLIDIPLSNVFSAFYLLRSLGEDKVVLFGEAENRQDAIKIYPNWYLAEIPGKHFSLALNQDSFPEIERAQVLGYLKEIRRTTRQYFLSINQEGESPLGEFKQLNVCEIMRRFGGYERLQRNRYWLREGYGEELYRILN